MNFVDLSANSRVLRQAELTEALRLCKTPFDALMKYAQFLGQAYSGRGHVVLSTTGLLPGQYRIWRMRGDDGVERVPLTDPWRKTSLPIHGGGTLARLISTGEAAVAHNIHWPDDGPFAGELKIYHSAAAVPLRYQNLPLSWSIFLARGPEEISVADVEESITRATLFGSLLDSLYVGFRLSQVNAQIEEELQRMARIQRALLPEPIPKIAGLDIATSYETFSQVGGDIYDVIPLNDARDRCCFFIGDASGHGPSAAVSAAMAQATLHACAADSAGPASLCRTLNQHLCHKRVEGSFVTAFVGFYEPRTRRLTYSLAGHPSPMFVPAESQISSLAPAGGLPLGVDESANYLENTIEIPPRRTLVLYTDGVTESRGPNGEMFGEPGLESSLRGAENADDCIAQLRLALALHQRGHRPEDDQTAVAVHVRDGE